jgi:hypothetical protein
VDSIPSDASETTPANTFVPLLSRDSSGGDDDGGDAGGYESDGGC